MAARGWCGRRELATNTGNLRELFRMMETPCIMIVMGGKKTVYISQYQTVLLNEVNFTIVKAHLNF